jgi:CheY-like chemotaxis protein
MIRILLIEDNRGDAVLIRQMLRSSQDPEFDLQHAAKLNEGLEWLVAGEFDLLLLDLGLPGSGGFQTFLRAFNAAAGVPIIVFTGTDNPQVVLECIKGGAKDYVVKSRIDRETLIQAIQRAVQQRTRAH